MPTKIEWTDETWNPVTGCSPVSAGCQNCYARRMAHRLECMGHPRYAGLTELHFRPHRNGVRRFNGTVRCHEDQLEKPLHWRKSRKIFVCSMSDLLHPKVPDEFRDKAFDMMWRCPQHIFQVLTKRAAEAARYVYDRACGRKFGWVERERTPMSPGDIFHMDDWLGRWQCGYRGDDDDRRDVCLHPAAFATGEENSCWDWDTDDGPCPLLERVDDRKTLESLEVADEHTFDADGYTDDCDWYRLAGRPKHAALANLWLGFSAANQPMFTARMQEFQRLRWDLGPACTLFASLEPLLGPIDFHIPYPECEPGDGARWNALAGYDFSDGYGKLFVPYLNQIIVGGESGPGARPMEADWVRSIRDQCVAAGVAFFFKQWGQLSNNPAPNDPTAKENGGTAKGGRMLDGRTWEEMPGNVETDEDK